MSPPQPLAGASVALGSDMPSYYSLNVSGVGGGTQSIGMGGMRSGVDMVTGHAPSHLDRRNEQQQLTMPLQHNVHQLQHHVPASPQASQDSLGSSASLGCESASGFGAGSSSSRSSEILQVPIFPHLLREPPPLPSHFTSSTNFSFIRC
jgi:hypothetical protein